MRKITVEEMENDYKEAMSKETGVSIDSVKIGAISRSLIVATVNSMNRLVERTQNVSNAFPEKESE